MDLERAKKFISPNYRYAVVGASTHQEKYGYRVLLDFFNAGFNVVGVNPNARVAKIAGAPVYAKLQDVPGRIDVAVVVVSPDEGWSVLDDANYARVTKLWFQPGAESDQIREKAMKLGMDIVADGSCIMVAREQLRQQSGN